MNLQEIRKKLDKVDYDIVKLLNIRMELALKTKKFKEKTTDSNREKEVLEKIKMNASAMINPKFCEKLYSEIIAESKILQDKNFQLIGFQGEHGAYSEVAARHWNIKLIPIPCNEFAEVFEGVKTGLYDYGVVPVENTLGGIVDQVNALLINTDIFVVSAIDLPIHHSLLVLPGTEYREIRAVYSHAQALSQCREFLARNKLTPIPYYDTAGAAKMLVEDMPQASAVIASSFAAEFYNLEVIKENIEDLHTNRTRFLILSKSKSSKIGDKCSIIFRTKQKAGTLFKVLKVFADKEINLTRIESVPDQPGAYAFFLDFLGSLTETKVIKALDEVKNITTKFKLVGCYKETKLN